MDLQAYQEWIEDNKAQFKKYKEYLEIRYDQIKEEIVITTDREVDLVDKGQARMLSELIDELR